MEVVPCEARELGYREWEMWVGREVSVWTE